MSRRRILMTVDAVGGVWQYATELATSLVPSGYYTILALLGPPPSPAQRKALARARGVTLVETGLPLDWLAPGAKEVEAAGAAIAGLAAAQDVDLVQLNQPALAAAATFAMPTAVVVHSCVASWWQAVRGGDEPESFAWQTSLVRRGLGRAGAIVCPSHAFAAAVRARYVLPAMPDVVHNGRTPLAKAAGGLHDFAFTAGRLWDEGKNVATLDRAAARLGIPFKAAGPIDAPDGGHVTLQHLQPMGTIDERTLAGCLASQPVFVSSARYEPFGLAVLEAALAGCALVLSDIPTFRELWDDVALFVDPEDAEGFAEAIQSLVGDMPGRVARGDRARRHATRFTPGRMAAGMADVYSRLLGQAPRRRVAA